MPFLSWIFYTLTAAVFQTTRTSLQKHLAEAVGNNVSNWIRYIFGLPVAFIYLLFSILLLGKELPDINLNFLAFSFMAAVIQVLGTGMMIKTFRKRNYAVGVVYVKTETIQSAFLAFLFLGEILSAMSAIAIAMGTLGIILTSIRYSKNSVESIFSSILSKETAIGLFSGALFAISGIFVKKSLTYLNQDIATNVAFTLFVMVSIQTVLMSAWVFHNNRGNFANICGNLFIRWKTCLTVGVSSVLGSICWFTAFALANIAYVKTVGQMDLLFSIIVTKLVFKEAISKLEAIGMSLTVGGIILLILSV